MPASKGSNRKPAHPSTIALRLLRRQIGADLRALRVARGMTLARLAKLTGVPVWRLDHYEMGKGEVSLEALVQVWQVMR